MGAEAVGQLLHALDRLVAAFLDDVRRAELPGQRDPVLVVAEHDDPLGAEPLRGDHAAQADGAVADDRHGLAGPDLGGERRVVARRHHVREREQRRHQRIVLVDRKRDERSVSLRHAHGFALTPVDSVQAVAASVQARRVQPFAAEDARAVGPDERRDHEVAFLDRLNLGSGLLDHADELVSHPPAARGRLHLLVRPEVASADRGARHRHERVRRLDEARVGDVLDAHISGCIHHGCAHTTRARPLASHPGLACASRANSLVRRATLSVPDLRCSATTAGASYAGTCPASRACAVPARALCTGARSANSGSSRFSACTCSWRTRSRVSPSSLAIVSSDCGSH